MTAINIFLLSIWANQTHFRVTTRVHFDCSSRIGTHTYTPSPLLLPVFQFLQCSTLFVDFLLVYYAFCRTIRKDLKQRVRKHENNGEFLEEWWRPIQRHRVLIWTRWAVARSRNDRLNTTGKLVQFFPYNSSRLWEFGRECILLEQRNLVFRSTSEHRFSRTLLRAN